MRRTSSVVLVTGLVAQVACGGGETKRDPAVTALQIELLERVKKDQAIRDSVFGSGTEMNQGALIRMQAIDADNTSWLKEQIRQHGWPSAGRVGKDAGNAAFLIVQHAVHDPEFQRRMLDTITAGFQRGEVDGQSYALLFDRVHTQAGEKQRYGTQAKILKDRIQFDPIEDSSRVDSLRRTVGLPTLAEYARVLDSVYFGKKKAVGKSEGRKVSK